MKKVDETEAGKKYAAAHEAHYTTKDLAKALGQYRAVMDTHPETQEAEYSRSQIQNIVSAVVPKQEILDVCVNLAHQHLEAPLKTDIEATSVDSGSAGPSSSQE